MFSLKKVIPWLNGCEMPPPDPQKSRTRRVLSETKAIMSPPVCHWMESNFFVE